MRMKLRELYMTIGEYIKQRRKELSLSAEQVAEYCEVNPATVYRWESGKIGDIPGKKIKALAEILRISPSIIVGSKDDDDVHEKDIPNKTITIPSFTTAQEAVRFILMQPLVADFGGYDLNEMTDEEIIAFANEIAGMIRFAAEHHYNKKE